MATDGNVARFCLKSLLSREKQSTTMLQDFIKIIGKFEGKDGKHWKKKKNLLSSQGPSTLCPILGVS